MATHKIRLKSSDIINAESVKEQICSLLTEACKMIRDRAREHVKENHYRTGRLHDSIRYSTREYNTKRGYTITGKVFINEDETPAEKTNKVHSYSYFITHGTNDWHRTISEAQEGRKKALMWFDKREHKKYRALWHRRGIEADDILGDALESCRSEINSMVRDKVKVINVEF